MVRKLSFLLLLSLLLGGTSHSHAGFSRFYLAPASTLKVASANPIEEYIRFIHQRLPKSSAYLATRLSDEKYFEPTYKLENFLLDPVSVYVKRGSFTGETHISFSYYRSSGEGYLVRGIVRSEPGRHTVSYREYPLQSFRTIAERTQIRFKEPAKDSKDRKPGKWLTGRIGNHEAILKKLISDNNFMISTVWNIYVQKPFEKMRFSERPISPDEIESVEVVEDERGSQKQNYRVTLRLIDGVQLPSFALKLGINLQNQGSFREGEIDHLQALQKSGTVPILGAFEKVEAIGLDPEHETLFRKRGVQGPITIEAYSEEFIEGSTLSQGLHLSNVYDLTEISSEEFHSEQVQQGFLFQKPGRFYHKAHDGAPRYFKFGDRGPVLTGEHIKKIITTWTRAAIELTPATAKDGKMMLVSDMQGKNIMLRLNRAGIFPDGDDFVSTQIDVVGNPVIIDVGNIVSRKPSACVMLLNEYYYSYLVARAPPKYTREFFAKLMDPESLKQGGLILDGIIEAYPRPDDGLEMLNQAYEELIHSKKIEPPSSILVDKMLKEKSSQDKEKILWPSITLELLKNYAPLRQYRSRLRFDEDLPFEVSG